MRSYSTELHHASGIVEFFQLHRNSRTLQNGEQDDSSLSSSRILDPVQSPILERTLTLSVNLGTLERLMIHPSDGAGYATPYARIGDATSEQLTALDGFPTFTL